MGLTLVIGATRSGKSAFAEGLARQSGMPVRYVATADPRDRTMQDRIAIHAARRPPDWETVVAGDDLTRLLARGTCVLIDGLGTWIAGIMQRSGEGAGPRVLAEMDALARAADNSPDPVIVVAEQAGGGTLPADALSRAWLDLLGEATQVLSDRAQDAVLVVAGRPMPLAPHMVRAADAVAPTNTVSEADLRLHGDTLVRPGDADHAVNVLAGGPPDWLREALAQALEHDLAAYPREDEAMIALAALHGRAPHEIVPTNGAAHALWMLPLALRPRLAACIHPGFTETEAALRAHGVPVSRVLRDAEDDFRLDRGAVPEIADLVIVGNPASPSGTLDPLERVNGLRRPGRVVVVDEAFMDLVPGQAESLVRRRLPDVIVIRSMTKSLGVPGLRAGYAVAASPICERLRAVRPPWSSNALALAAMRALAGRPEAFEQAAARAQEEREDLERRLAQIPGVRIWPAAANYVLARVHDGVTVAGRLREQRIAVRPAGTFPGLTSSDLRITARDPRSNERLAQALAAAVQRR